MSESEIEVEVAFAKPDKQIIIAVKLKARCSVQLAISQSGILEQFCDIDLSKMAVGIFAKVCDLDTLVADGDRIEIYRPLLQHPMDARRNRAGR